MARHLITALIVGLALVAAAPALADAPDKTTSVRKLGPFVDDETCSFPITVTVERVATSTTFANGDWKRHVDLAVVQTANGHTAVETDRWDIFVDNADPDSWKLTGRFGQIFLDGRLIYLNSGLIGYDPATDTLTDPQPGPNGELPDPCVILAT